MPAKRSLKADLRRRTSEQPKHERLSNHLLAEMVAGRLKPGQILPSEHELTEAFGVARTTVRQAMASLEHEGLIRRVQGKGTFVEADVRQKLNRGQDIFALVVPETLEGFYPSLLHGFEAAAGEIHHQTIICSTDDNVERQADIILQLLDKKVGGVALNPTSPRPTPDYQVRQLQDQGIPVVFCHRPVTGVAAPVLAIPFREVGRLAGRSLAERGHRRVGFFFSHWSPAAEAYQNGLRESLRAAGGDISTQAGCVDQRTNKLQEEAIWTALQQTFAKPEPPTAIFASFDSLAEMIYLLLPRLGLRVPQDVSLVGFGGAWRKGALTRRLTSVVIDEIATGRQAVRLLHEMRQGSRAIDDNEEFVLPLELSKGETLGPPPYHATPINIPSSTSSPTTPFQEHVSDHR
jgi:GntR family transcriptional regulator, arabinose operon transcriptional repressor